MAVLEKKTIFLPEEGGIRAGAPHKPQDCKILGRVVEDGTASMKPPLGDAKQWLRRTNRRRPKKKGPLEKKIR